MRLILTSIGALFVCLIAFIIIKMWGQSQVYIEYKHPLYSISTEKNTDKNQNKPLIFNKPQFKDIPSALKANTPIYLNIASTLDEKLVIVPNRGSLKYEVRHKKYIDIQNDVLPLEDSVADLKKRPVILNITESAVSGHIIFTEELKRLGLDKADNIILTSPYDPVAKSIKEKLPLFLYATTMPEILRIKAMESFYLIEAASYRADIVIHPLKLNHRDFYTETLMNDVKKRFKKIIVGPIQPSDVVEAEKLQPFAIVVEN